MINYMSDKDIQKITECYIRSFSGSITAKLGDKFASKVMEWYITDHNCFMFYIEEDGKCIGFCGGKIGVGSSSAMLQYAFRSAFFSLFLRPWLICDPLIISKSKFILSNIKNKLFNSKATNKSDSEYNSSIGLITIGVDPSGRGKGIADLLMNEFDNKVLSLGYFRAHLSVNKNNLPAIRLYQRNGWSEAEESGKDGIVFVKNYDKKRENS
tara:strand:- start:46 stop:678 length:633 start_codon:yes stop_codon:yes gene_type:complete